MDLCNDGQSLNSTSITASCVHMEFDYALFDAPLILFEIICLGSNFPTLGSFGIKDWSSPLLNCYTVLACIICAALILEAGIWVRVILWHKASQQPNHHHLDPGSLGSEVIPRPHSVVFGPWLWKEHLSGETRTIRGIRGSIAVAITLIILFYSVLDLLFYPFQNTGLDYLKEVRSLGVPNNVAVNNLVWNVIVIGPAIQFPVNYSYIDSQWEDNFLTAINVTPLWSTKPDPGSLSCVYLRPDVREYLPDLPGVGPSKYWEPGYRNFDTYTTPDLLIEVNFTAFNISGSSKSDMSSNSVQVLIGFHNETSKVIQTTKSMTLVPGINMLGCITYELRQSFKNSIAPDLGLFESYDTFVVSKMLYAIPDPLASASSTFIKQAPDISTFRVFLQHDYSDLKTLQSYRQQDTLSGFAAVGGLWTFLSGIFAAIFGSSLLRILFAYDLKLGVKPISLAGVAHSIEREKIQEACRREYPRILDEIRLPPEERGLLSLLCDQLIDVKIIEREGRKSGGYVAQSGRGGEDVEMDQLESLKR
ncbi:hypothetical protein CVT26_000442 [Gymnopilus dilepis]|uniref:Uncharacterized protein n=1 Tax=Gymnopilus dilepis TaxID=231916 RepID=A0A409WKX2_9AGAR|nr:hypothetical protein CVT26_000442 [Gymnopilus dilepis]